MQPLRHSRPVLAAQVLVAVLPAMAGLAGEVPATEAPLRGVILQGGSLDDDAYARAAAGLTDGLPLGEPAFQTALAAIRATDRFRAVRGQLETVGDGVRARVQLDPWPVLEALDWQAPLPRKLLNNLRIGLRLGSRIGDQALEVWRKRTQVHLVEAGYPEGTVAAVRHSGDRILTITVVPGRPALIRRVELQGAFVPHYKAAKLISLAKLEAGQTLWTEVGRQEALRLLRNKLYKDKHFEAQVELTWDGRDTATLEVNPGPVVRLKADGDSLGVTTQVKDLVPVGRANRYSAELLDEGDRRIVRTMRGRGYLEAQVGHVRKVLKMGPAGEEEVLITYTLRRGERTRLAGVRIEGNAEIPTADLVKAAGVKESLFNPGGPLATPDLMDAVEARIKAHYQAQGYTEIGLRLLPLERQGSEARLAFRVREGPRRLVRWLKLDLPPGAFNDPWGLGECLTLLFSSTPKRLPGPDSNRVYRSDFPSLPGVTGILTSGPDPARPGGTTLSLELSRPIPMLKGDLARVFTALRGQRLSALGVQRPVVRLKVEPLADGGAGIHLEVPSQPMAKVQRLVVQGSDKTRARAVLRETRINPGAPLDVDQLSRSQARLSYLGAFQRVDLNSLAEPGPDVPPEAGENGPPSPWKDGDLLLRLEERSPWVLSSGFGYDKSQGYHIGLGVQRLNLGGMGRTADLGIRAGDGALDIPWMKRAFETDKYGRSVDAFTLGYSDPWFAPPFLEAILPERPLFRTEGAYIYEIRSLYKLRRRRFLSSIQWNPRPEITYQLGYRFERVEVRANTANNVLITSEDLAVTAQYPQRAIISAPYFQVARDTRDNGLDPTSGSYSVGRMELANQLFLTSRDNSFVKLDLRQQWTWPVGYKASNGVLSLGLRVGLARPTASSAENLPLSERFFAGGPFTYRGAEPDALGARVPIPLRDPATLAQLKDKDGNPVFQETPVGGQGLALANLEYRFPLIGQSVWGEVFLDSGQVYEYLTWHNDLNGVRVPPKYPALRTALGVGVILKIGVPLKIEYAMDIKRLLRQPRSQDEQDTQLKSLLISAGFQF